MNVLLDKILKQISDEQNTGETTVFSLSYSFASILVEQRDSLHSVEDVLATLGFAVERLVRSSSEEGESVALASVVELRHCSGVGETYAMEVVAKHQTIFSIVEQSIDLLSTGEVERCYSREREASAEEEEEDDDDGDGDENGVEVVVVVVNGKDCLVVEALQRRKGSPIDDQRDTYWLFLLGHERHSNADSLHHAETRTLDCALVSVLLLLRTRDHCLSTQC